MKSIARHIATFTGRIDWPLLLFVVAATNLKIYVKIAALVAYGLYILLRRRSLTLSPVRPVWFYLSMPVLGVLGAAMNGSFQRPEYAWVAAWGVLLWLVAGAACYLLSVRLRAADGEKLHATIQAFFLANLIVSLVQLVNVMIVSHSLLPYWYYDAGDVYGASTGDYIYGVFGGASVTNSTVSALGALWFLYRRRIGMAIACICTMMLCTSNITLVFFLLIAAVMAVTVKKPGHRLVALSLIVLSAVLYIALSPANIWYIEKTWNRFVSHAEQPVVTDTATARFKGQYWVIAVPDSVYNKNRQALQQLKQGSDSDTSRHNLALGSKAVNAAMEQWYGKPVNATPLAFWSKPGKLYACMQTANFAKTSVQHAIAGAGIGNFSSKLAVKATGLGIEGRYPQNKVYAGRDFMQGHLYTALYYFSQPAVAHSMMNMPNSVYNQLLGEYGLAGAAMFLLLYAGFFIRHWRRLKATRYLLPAVLLFFCYEYWFEMVSLTVIFELLGMTDIFSTDNNERNTTAAHYGTDAGL